MLKISKLLMGVLIVVLMVVGCGKSELAAQPSVEAEKETGEVTTEVEDGKKVKITYWHHDGAGKTNPIYEELINQFMLENPNIEVEYLGLPADSFFQKYLTAVATNSGPDVFGMRIGELSAMVAQNALEPLDDYVPEWSGYTNIEPALIDTIRQTISDQKLYMLPQYFNHDISWYNVNLFEEKGIEPPDTISEFLEMSEKYADPLNNKYFYTIRGTKGYRNTLTWLVNYTGIIGEDNSLYNEDGTSIFRDPAFAKALDAYASIYKNNWCSQDSITANYKEMVAEFGTGTSMYIQHDSSSVVEHSKNLGDGNFMNALPVANDETGVRFVLALDPIGAAVSSKSENKEAAFKLVSYMSSKEGISFLAENIGKLPANKEVYEEEWFKNDPYMTMYPELLSDPSVEYYNTPIYLEGWKKFQSMVSDDFQAILMGKATSEDTLKTWADTLEQWYAEYNK